jgi:hypothetical protein
VSKKEESGKLHAIVSIRMGDVGGAQTFEMVQGVLKFLEKIPARR